MVENVSRAGGGNTQPPHVSPSVKETRLQYNPGSQTFKPKEKGEPGEIKKMEKTEAKTASTKVPKQESIHNLPKSKEYQARGKKLTDRVSKESPAQKKKDSYTKIVKRSI